MYNLETGKTRVLFDETERISKQQVLPKSERKWRSNEEIISDTRIGNYHQRHRLTAEKSVCFGGADGSTKGGEG